MIIVVSGGGGGGGGGGGSGGRERWAIEEIGDKGGRHCCSLLSPSFPHCALRLVFVRIKSPTQNFVVPVGSVKTRVM